MSINYTSLTPVIFEEIFDGRLDAKGVREHKNPASTSSSCRCLTDGQNLVWLYADSDGGLADAKCYAFNNPSHILRTLQAVFDTTFVSEYQPQYWGFESQDDWDKALEDLVQQRKIEIRRDDDALLIKFSTLQETGNFPFDERSEVHRKLLTARKVTEGKPELLSPDRKQDLLKAIHRELQTSSRELLSDDNIPF